MSEKYFVGADLIASSNNGKYKPVSRVTLTVDDSNVITAGDDTGLELIAPCPHATQEIADELLDKLRGYTYQAFEADEANLNPSAELGDGVTAGGIYGAISKLRDDGSGFVGISAPGKAELEDDYPMDGPITQMMNRQLAQTRSLISKTLEEIRLEVIGTLTDEEGNPISVASAIELSASGIKSTVKQDYEKYVGDRLGNLTDSNGKPITVESAITQSASSVKTEVYGYFEEDENGDPVSVSSSIEVALKKIELSVSDEEGSTTFELTSGGAKLTSTTFDLHVKAVHIEGELEAKQIKVKDYIHFPETGWVEETEVSLQSWSESNKNPNYIKSTYIDRVSIQSPTIMAGTFIGNEFNVLSESSGGSFNLYGKFGNYSVRALEISYAAGDAPVVYFGGAIARFNFGAVYYDCGIDLGQYDLTFNAGGYLTSLRDMETRLTALERQ